MQYATYPNLAFCQKKLKMALALAEQTYQKQPDNFIKDDMHFMEVCLEGMKNYPELQKRYSQLFGKIKNPNLVLRLLNKFVAEPTTYTENKIKSFCEQFVENVFENFNCKTITLIDGISGAGKTTLAFAGADNIFKDIDLIIPSNTITPFDILEQFGPKTKLQYVIVCRSVKNSLISIKKRKLQPLAKKITKRQQQQYIQKIIKNLDKINDYNQEKFVKNGQFPPIEIKGFTNQENIIFEIRPEQIKTELIKTTAKGKETKLSKLFFEIVKQNERSGF